MPKRNDISKILVIGSGPIIIGQACEFDYSGTQALKALREEGYKVILVNSNPATIMTDPDMAHKVYIEPLTVSTLEDIIIKEKPEALLPTIGGQTALNLAMELFNEGILNKYSVELLGANVKSIEKTESRELFKNAMHEIGVEVAKSGIAKNLDDAVRIAEDIGYPLIIRPAFTLGGTGGAVVYKFEDLKHYAQIALDASPTNEILIEESLLGWKEYELELMRDKNDNCVVVCTIENVDPMGVHTGDSITVAPSQTLTDVQYQNLRTASFKIMRAMGVDTGGSNIQFAVDPDSDKFYAIEMNPRVSRSSALASKATGFPIAKIAAKLAVGYTLDEIPNDITKKTPASFEPVIDYVVVKIPRFAFEKFLKAEQTLGTSMKSVGEVMAIARTFNEALQKALRGLEIGRDGLGCDGKGMSDLIQKYKSYNDDNQEKVEFINTIKNKLILPNCDRIFNIKYAFDLGISTEEIVSLTKIDYWFISQIKKIVDIENELLNYKNASEIAALIKKAKLSGFSDKQILYLTKLSAKELELLKNNNNIYPVYKSVDTCAAEFESYTPYYYSSYEDEDEIISNSKDSKGSVLIIGGGPNRIGQGIEFDYCICHASFALKEEGYTSIIVNSNPETVSTDYDTSDKLYFEPLTAEDIINIIKKEKPLGAIFQLGGQTPINLIKDLKEHVSIIGTDHEAVDIAEDRSRFSSMLNDMNILHPQWKVVSTLNEAISCSEKIGYPVIIRPSYVLGGSSMEVIYSADELRKYFEKINASLFLNPNKQSSENKPETQESLSNLNIFIDKFLDNALEVDVDALSDGESVFVSPLMEHIEKAGIHSGDSACVTPPITLSKEHIDLIISHTKSIALKLQIKGLMNIQFAIKNDNVYVLEVNPRASRTVPFISKVIGIPLVKIATKIMLGKKLSDFDLGFTLNDYSVKEVVLPFSRFTGVDPILGPEMKSTGEVMGRGKTFNEAFCKAQLGAGNVIKNSGDILVSLSRQSKDNPDTLELMRKYAEKYNILATPGTAGYLNNNGIKAIMIDKIGRSNFDVEDIINREKINLIINTPTGKKAFADGYIIRTKAYQHRIPLITTLSAANAFIVNIY